MIEVIFNGKKISLEKSVTIMEFIDIMGIDIKKAAIEKNRFIIPKSQHHSVEISDGDAIECVEFVGGG